MEQKSVSLTYEQKMIDKAVAIAAANRVVNTSKKGVWLVGSQAKEDKFYIVEYFKATAEKDSYFRCQCHSWDWNNSHNKIQICKHILSIYFHEGRNV